MFQWRDHCEKKMENKYLTVHGAEQSEREDINLKIINKKQNKNILSTHNYTKLTTSTMMKVMKK